MNDASASPETAPPETAPRERRSRTWRRVAAVSCLVLLAAEVLYLILAHAFLLSPIGHRTINRRPHRLAVEWSSAISPLPGLVRVAGLRLRGQSRRTRWQAEVDRAWLTVDLFHLSRRRFVSRWTRIDGAVLHVDPELRPEAEPAAGRPPIPPLASETGRTRPPGARRREPWRIELRNLRAGGLREVWIGRSRSHGDATLHADLDYQLRGELHVNEASIELRDGIFEFDGVQVARDVRLRTAAAAPPFVPREVEVVELLESLRGEIELEAHVGSAGFLRRFLRQQSWLELDGEGVLNARAAFSEGELSQGSRMRLRADPVSARILGQPASGVAVVVAERKLGATGISLDAVFERFALGASDGPKLVEGEGLEVHLESTTPRLFRPLELRTADIALPRSPLRDLRALDAFLPAAVDMGFESGQGEIEGHLRFDTERGGDGKLRLDLRDVNGHFQETLLRGDLALRLEASQVDLNEGAMSLDGSEIRLDRVAVRAAGAEAPAEAEPAWWGRAALGKTRLRLGPPLLLEGSASLRLRDSGPIVALLAERRPLLRWIDDLLTVEDVAGELAWRVDRAGIELRSLHVSAPPIDIRATLRLAESRRTGVVRLGYRGFSAGFELLPDGGRDWHLTETLRWYQSRSESFLAGRPAAPAQP